MIQASYSTILLVHLNYNIVYMTKKAVKGSILSDHLADHVVEEYKPLNLDIPNEDVLVVEDDDKVND